MYVHIKRFLPPTHYTCLSAKAGPFIPILPGPGTGDDVPRRVITGSLAGLGQLNHTGTGFLWKTYSE